MSLFMNKDKTQKSTIALSTFVVTLVFLGIFALLYRLLAEPLYRYVQIGGTSLTTLLHCLVIAVIGTLLCCTLFVLHDKRLVPYGFVGLAILLLVCYLMTLFLAPDSRGLMIMFLTTYGVAPVLVGNVTAWAIYLKLRRVAEHSIG